MRLRKNDHLYAGLPSFFLRHPVHSNSFKFDYLNGIRDNFGQGSRSSMSLPRQSNQLHLKSSQDKNKRNSGAWSKPPTPGPLSPATSDSEASCYNYRSGIHKSSMI